MCSAEVVTQLRSLNWLREEAECFPAGSMLRRLLEGQQEVVRHRLPAEIWQQCKKSIESGRPSLTSPQRSRCGACNTRLPDAMLKEVRLANHFISCPNCGTFICAPRVSPRARPIPSVVETGRR